MCVLPSVLLCGLAPVLTTYWLNVWRERLRFRVKIWIKTSGERWERKGNASECEVWVFETSSSSACSCEVMMHCTLHPSCLTSPVSTCVFDSTYRSLGWRINSKDVGTRTLTSLCVRTAADHGIVPVLGCQHKIALLKGVVLNGRDSCQPHIVLY